MENGKERPFTMLLKMNELDSFNHDVPENKMVSKKFGVRFAPCHDLIENYASVLRQKFVIKVGGIDCLRTTPSPVPPRLEGTPVAVHPLPQGGEGVKSTLPSPPWGRGAGGEGVRE